MSGIVGIINLDGAPVDRALLSRLTNYLAFRGPDAQNIWTDGAVGFGHTLLRTTAEASFEHSPCSLDSQTWIVADARIDGREELVGRLGLASRLNLAETPDVELILHAYAKWGEDCVNYLIGDFAFAIWDTRQQRLFCARDQFGLKLFYYAQVGNTFIFSNTLNCIRLHPQVSSTLNEAAIGDFLIFGQNYNSETTTFADIQRLPGGHILMLAGSNVTKRRYWTLPLPKQIRYKRDSEYIEHFKELMGQAVADRLRNENEKVAVFFSGGLDSTTIAATALDVAKKRMMPLDLQAFTVVYDSLIPDQERYYAGLAANALNIPLHYFVADDFDIYQGWDTAELKTPEPCHSPLSIISYQHSVKVAAHSRVALYGQGSDEALNSGAVLKMVGKMPTLHLLNDVLRSILRYHLRPYFGTKILHVLQTQGKKELEADLWPEWLNPEFVARLDLKAHYDEVNNRVTNIDYVRSTAYTKFLSPVLDSLFEFYDPGISNVNLEVRWPFLDLRLLGYLLALPPLPWCFKKELLRISMRGILPEAVRQRSKTTLAGDPVSELLPKGRIFKKDLAGVPHLTKYVNTSIELLQDVIGYSGEIDKVWINLRPLSLAYWLRSFATQSFETVETVSSTSH